MSTRCNIVVREERNLRREIILYKHHDGAPVVMVPMLHDMLNKCLSLFQQNSTYQHWMSDPTKVAGMLVHLSVPVVTEEAKKALDSSPAEMRDFLERYFFQPIPTITPEGSRAIDTDYEYTITLREKMEDNKGYVFGVTIEVARMANGKKQFVLEEVSYATGKSGFERERTASGSPSKSSGATPQSQGVRKD